jgi:hypothetical protein
VLADHLVREFAVVGTESVLRELADARDAVDVTRLDASEALRVAELIARHQLLLLTGDATESARLDPECHPPRDTR